MGIGQAVIIGGSLLLITAALAVCIPLALRRKPAEKVWHVWNPAGRLTLVGDPWPDHDEDYEDCGCRSCYSVEITLMQDDEVLSLFLGRIDTPEGYELADRARRYIR